MTAHWGVSDPAAVRGTQEEVDRAFRSAFLALQHRIGLFLCLPFAALDRLALKKEVDKIGQANWSTEALAKSFSMTLEAGLQ